MEYELNISKKPKEITTLEEILQKKKKATNKKVGEVNTLDGRGRKPIIGGETISFNIRISTDSLKKLNKIVKINNDTKANVIRQVLEDYINLNEDKIKEN